MFDFVFEVAVDWEGDDKLLDLLYCYQSSLNAMMGMSMIAPNIIQEVTVPYMNCNSSKSTMCYLSQLLMRGCSERERDRVLFEQARDEV